MSEKTCRMLLTVSLLILAGCGYHVAGHNNTLPATIHTIAVPAFKNETPRFKIEQFLTTAVVRELLARTRYKVQAEPDESDAVLRGVVTGFYTAPVVYDPKSNRATTVSVNVRLRVSLVERKSGKVLFENQDYLYTERYEIGQQSSGYFEESDAALQRLSRTVASALISAILEGF
jgi:Lipopolysaccharide-assembly